MTDEKNPFDGPGGGGGDDGGDDGGWNFNEKDIKTLRIPKGRYRMRCLDTESGHSRVGNEMITIALVIVKGPHEGREFKTYLTKGLASLWKLKDTLDAFGIQPNAKGDYIWQPSDLRDRGVIADIVDDTYDGQEKSTIKRLNKLEGEPAGGKSRGSEIVPPRAQPEEEDRPQHAPPPEDDIPF